MSPNEASVEKYNRRLRIVEVAVVMTLYWVPMMVYAAYGFFVIGPRNSTGIYDPTSAWLRTLQDSCTIPVILFVIWGSGEPWKKFGLGLGWRWAPLLIVPFYLFSRVVTGGMHALIWPDSPSRSLWDQMLPMQTHGASISWTLAIAIIVHVLINSFLQEFVMRGYLIPRLTDITRRPWIAYITSALMFGAFHLYQGVGSMTVVFADGIVLTLMYAISKSVWPGTILHSANNFIAYFVRLARF